MAITTSHVLAFALAIILGGLIGTALNIEDIILNWGKVLQKRFAISENSQGNNFAYGVINATIFFCGGAMTIIGSFKAGTEGNYDLILTKSVMDGFVAIIFTGAMGIGVGFSALSILIYQGLLTICGVWLQPYVSAGMLGELSAVGGSLIIMIGINLLGMKKIQTANFLPALVIIVILSLFFGKVPVL
jgi:uncharacterized membrane protein YqgA involved in biofilm formation